MILYASATGTRRNLHALQVHGWRLLFSSAAPDQWRPEGWRYALDNGAWTAHASGQPWDEDAFRHAVEVLGAGADWTIAPDIVAGGRESLELSVRWLDWLGARSRRVLIAVQDGMVPADVRDLVGPDVGIAVGGATEWKEAELASGRWADLCASRGAWLHALRVNTARRMAACVGCTSCDGSSASRFAVNTPRLTQAAAQLGMGW